MFVTKHLLTPCTFSTQKPVWKRMMRPESPSSLMGTRGSLVLRLPGRLPGCPFSPQTIPELLQD